jgi:ABC-type lipopolysaccharide export system ATPase subunit
MQEVKQMRKKLYTRNVGVLVTEDSYHQLINITDKLEVTVSGYIRDMVERELKKYNEKEKE